MKQIHYKEALGLIQSIDRELSALMEVVFNQSQENIREKLCFWSANYSFTKLMFKNGVPLGPDQKALPAELLLKNGLPFGLVLKNTVEVLDEVIQSVEVVEMPQALLAEGQLIGVFEYLDEHLNAEGRPTPNWTISAGSRSFKFLDLPTQKGQWSRLRSKYPQLSTYYKVEAQTVREIDLLQTLMEGNGPWQNWWVPILYFSPAWFNEVDSQLLRRDTWAAAMKLRNYIFDLAWKSLAKVRDRQNELEDAIYERGGDQNVARCKAAYRLLRYSMDIVAQRRPCFAPFSSGVNLGPFEEMREQVLKFARLNDQIMVPTYIDLGQVGFLSLSHLVPAAFVENPADSLEDIIKILVRARNETITTGREIPGLVDAPEILSKVTFRVKSGRRGQGEQASVSTFKVRFLPPNNRRGYEKELISLQEFYEPYFADGVYPAPDSRFFRVAIKLDLRNH